MSESQPEPKPTPELLQHIADVADRFESAWRRGERPTIAEHLALDCQVDGGPLGRDHLLRHLLRVEIELRRDLGEVPDCATYVAAWPDRADLILAVFALDVETIPDGSHHEWPGTLSSPKPEKTEPMPVPPTVRDPSAPVLEGFQVLEVIARGGMGVVYKALQVRLDRLVAIKRILPGVSPDRFRREAELIARIKSPHVVVIHTIHPLGDGGHAFVMEYVEGTDLARIIKERVGPLSEAEALPWMREVAQGMCAAAEARVIHRDLKPSNVLIDLQKHARVADFGLGRGTDDLASKLTHYGDVLGTPYYMAPEQAEDPQGVDTRADIYSFGATFYHALTGKPPFDGPSSFSVMFKHKTEPLVAPLARNPALSARTGEVLERCLAKSPGDRFPSFADLARHLEPKANAESPWDPRDDDRLEPFLSRYRARKPAYLDGGLPPGETDRYDFPGGRRLSIRRGNITEEVVDAIVSSDDEYLTMGGGVSRSIRYNGGPGIRLEAQRYIPVRPGRAVVTSAGGLTARFVFHGVTLSFERSGLVVPSRDLIAEIVASCFYHADTLNVRSIAFPLLGTGTGGFSREVCLDTIVRSLARALHHGPTCVEDARVVIYP